ncbi:hypothetical protein HII12_004888 [Brettanomyces bruxellensis]|uniref:Uncharacterized protein n=1 Tax=Dekkera bruxellensis TaxID=5007 RepID=A0A8H6EQN6_DEKBR|nr:hypothetical protein HII12_004888 [Brettanomyces bruxellensis]
MALHHIHRHPLHARDVSLTTDTFSESQTDQGPATTTLNMDRGSTESLQTVASLSSSANEHLATVFVTQTTMLSALPTDSAELSLLLDSLVSQGGYYISTNSSSLDQFSYLSSTTQPSGTSGGSSSEISSSTNSTGSNDILTVTSSTTSTTTQISTTSSDYKTIVVQYVTGTGDTITETTTRSPATLPIYTSVEASGASNSSLSKSRWPSSSATPTRASSRTISNKTSPSSTMYLSSTEYSVELTTIYPDYMSAGTPYYSTRIEYTQPFYVTDSLTTFNVEVPITTTAFLEIPAASSSASFTHPAVITTDLADFRNLHSDYVPDSLMNSSKKGLTRASVAGIAIGCTVGVIMALLAGIWFFFFRGKRRFSRTDSTRDLTEEKSGDFSDDEKNGRRGAYGTFDVDRTHDYSPAVPIVTSADSTAGDLTTLTALKKSPFAPAPPPPRKNVNNMCQTLPVVYEESETSNFEKSGTPVVADTLASFKIAGGKIRSIRPTKSSSDGSSDSEGRDQNPNRASSELHSSKDTNGNGSSRSSSSSLGANTSTDRSSSSNFSSDFDDIDTL